MREYLVYHPPTYPSITRDLLLRRPFLKDAAADVLPLPDITIHEAHPPQISGSRWDCFREFRSNPERNFHVISPWRVGVASRVASTSGDARVDQGLVADEPPEEADQSAPRSWVVAQTGVSA